MPYDRHVGDTIDQRGVIDPGRGGGGEFAVAFEVAVGVHQFLWASARGSHTASAVVEETLFLGLQPVLMIDN
jgi:hypothetical protein